jgi:hypothetical protein
MTMLIVIRKSASERDVEQIKQYLIDRDYDFHQSTGANRIIIGVIGNTSAIDKDELRRQSGVLEVFKIPDEE